MPSIAWNETRARGVLSVAAWLAHAAAAFPRATLVGKVDDDAYIHTVELEALLRGIVTQLAPNVDRLYLGSMSWFHWFPKIFERSGFGWTFSNAWGYGDGCRNATSAAIRCGSHQRIGASDDCGLGPFLSGYPMLFSTALAASSPPPSDAPTWKAQGDAKIHVARRRALQQGDGGIWPDRCTRAAGAAARTWHSRSI